MKTSERKFLGTIVVASILSVTSSASAFSIVFGEVDDIDSVRTNFVNNLDASSSSTVIDDGTNFGTAPALNNNDSVASITRNGTIGIDNFTYTIYDIDFADSPNGIIAPGTVGNDIDDLDNIIFETPANQDGASGSYDWGVDSGTGNGTSNAALFDFTGNSIGHFGVDLHDFEAGAGISSTNSTSGASGQIRLYKSGEIIENITLEFPGVDGGGSTDKPGNTDENDSTYEGYGNGQSMFVGISADNPNEFFDQVVFVVGDDDVDLDINGNPGTRTPVNDGSTERWAADGFTFGYAYKEVPFEFSPAFGIFLIGGFWAIHKLKLIKI